MKLETIHEAKYTGPPGKKGLKHLMKFFIEENIGGHGVVFYVQENFIVRNTNIKSSDNEVTMIEFPYANTDMDDHALIMYTDDTQDDILIKEMVKHFVVVETRQVY